MSSYFAEPNLSWSFIF